MVSLVGKDKDPDIDMYVSFMGPEAVRKLLEEYKLNKRNKAIEKLISFGCSEEFARESVERAAIYKLIMEML